MVRFLPEIRLQERQETYFGFFTLFGIMAAHALLETARDSLFLARIPPSHLAWAYLAIALLSLAIFLFQRREGSDQSRLVIWLLASSGVTLAFWFLVGKGHLWVLYLLYIWSGVFATLVIVRFWAMLAGFFTVGQAKRVFAFVGVGGVLGAITGSALAALLATWLDPRHLLLAAAAIQTMTVLGPSRLKAPKEPSSAQLVAKSESFDGNPFHLFETIWSSQYLRRLAGIVLLSTITFTLVDFLFKHAVANTIEAPQLASFFAASYFALNVLSLLAQLFLVGWLVRNLGIDRVLSILPLLLGVTALGIVAGGGLIASLIAKAFDGALRHSLHRTATEVLYVPLAAELRSRVKAFIDVLGQRGGQAIASLLILAVSALVEPTILLGAFVLLLSALWIRIGISIKDHYLDLFRASLSEVAIDTRLEFPELDLASLETLIARLNSSNDAEVVAVMELLAEQDRVKLLPALILYHPSPRVVVAALELFSRAGRTDFIPITERLLEGAAPEIKSATLRALAWVAPTASLYDRFRQEESPGVRTTALVGLVSYGDTSQSARALNSIRTLARSGSKEEKLALARAILYSPGAVYKDILLLLSEVSDTTTRKTVAQAMAEIRHPEFIGKLLQMLPERALRRQARATLVAIGDKALSSLKGVLANLALDFRIRLQTPRTVAEFEPEPAAEILLHNLATEPNGSVRYWSLRSLLYLRSTHRELELNRTVLQKQADRTLTRVFRLIKWQLLIAQANQKEPSRATLVQELIVDLLAEKEKQSVERLFQLLSLLYPEEDLRSMYKGATNVKRQVRASSVELLENLLETPLREAVIALIDDLAPEQKLKRAGPYFTSARVEYDQLLEQLLERPGVGLRCLVAHHIAELGIESLYSILRELPQDSAGFVSSTVERALGVASDRPHRKEGEI